MPTARLLMCSAAVAAAAVFVPADARAFCTLQVNPWAAACDTPDDDAVVGNAHPCDPLWQAELLHPTTVLHAIPVYLNFDEQPFPVVTPTKEIVFAHRSLTATGLSQEAVTTQVRAAIANWNQSAAGHPMLYLAGEIYGDTPTNPEVGINVFSWLCWEVEENLVAKSFQAPPNWSGPMSAYRAAVQLKPALHTLTNIPPGPCSSLPDPWRPMPAPADITWSARISEGMQWMLVHEFGHNLGLKHSFFGPPPGSASCGLGELGVDTAGVMDYGYNFVRPRRDDIEGVRALYAAYLPASWPMQAWRGSALLPGSADDEPSLDNLVTTVQPTAANVIVGPSSLPAPQDTVDAVVGFADRDHQVTVRTITAGVIDPAPNDTDIPRPGALGQTFAPVGVALARGARHKIFVIWNEDRTTRRELHTYWALKDVGSATWNNFGPANLVPQDVPNDVPNDADWVRYNPEIGATFDPVFRDFVIATTTAAYQPGLAIIRQDGELVDGSHKLENSAPFDDYNAIGAPVCLPRSTPRTSLCLLPIATTGELSAVGVLATVRQDDATDPFLPAVEWLPDAAVCRCGGDDCHECSLEAFGTVSLSWNDQEEHGYLSYGDDRGDVRWLRVDVGASDAVAFTHVPWSMPGNGKYAPLTLAGDAEQDAAALESIWPVCPYWSASSGGAADHVSSTYTVVRALCQGYCGDGFVEVPPFGAEECELDELLDETCESQGFEGGVLACTDGCTLDTSGCFLDGEEPVEPERGDCLPLEPCTDMSLDGCLPDGPGGSKSYCPGPDICGLAMVNDVVTPSCLVCPDVEQPEQNGELAPYGCPCATDSDCAFFGLGTPDNASNGDDVPLGCFGGEDDGWPQGGLGTCLPLVDESQSDNTIDEFQRTYWLCKQDCEAISAGTDTAHLCIFEDDGIELPYAACLPASCDGEPGVIHCADEGGFCQVEGENDEESEVCAAQCDIADEDGGDSDCVAWGYPDNWGCAEWAGGLCAPEPCVNASVFSALYDQNFCLQFLIANPY